MCYSLAMRFAALVLALAGCHAASAPLAPGGLEVRVSLGTAPTDGDVAIASGTLRLGQLAAVSDRSAGDARASVQNLELGLGDSHGLTLSSAPPGIYSAVDAELGTSSDDGLTVEAVWNAVRVHVTLAATPFDVSCPSPARLDPGKRVALTLYADPASWFDGIDLSTAASDADDEGIVIGDDDNRPMAMAVRANVLASFLLDCRID
jgi:hypothetical protein